MESHDTEHALLLSAQRRASASRTTHRVTHVTAEDRERLGDLDYVAWLLAGTFTPATAISWWTKPCAALSNDSPATCWYMSAQMRARVVAAAERLAS